MDVFFFKQKTAYEISACLVGSEMCIRDRFPLYAIIRQPLKYMMGLNGEQISAVADALNWATISIENGWVKNVAEGAANAFSNTGYNQLFLASLINPENLSTAQAAVGEGAAKMFAMNFQFLGLDLSQVPNAKFWVNGISWGSIGLFLIPAVSYTHLTLPTNSEEYQ